MITGTYSRTKISRGFTLVETLVAVSILLLIIISPMTIAYKGMQMGFYANQEMTAVFLAQEAIEALEKLRDDDALRSLNGTPAEDNVWSWYDALPSSCTQSGQTCDIDLSDYSFHTCSGSNCLLQYDPTPNKRAYGYGGAFTDNSIYTRNITLSGAGGTAYARPVTVSVSWTTVLFGTRTITLQTWLYNAYSHYEP